MRRSGTSPSLNEANALSTPNRETRRRKSNSSRERCEVTLTLGCRCFLNSNSPDTSSDFKMRGVAARRESRHRAVIMCHGESGVVLLIGLLAYKRKVLWISRRSVRH